MGAGAFLLSITYKLWLRKKQLVPFANAVVLHGGDAPAGMSAGCLSFFHKKDLHDKTQPIRSVSVCGLTAPVQVRQGTFHRGVA